MIWTSPRPNSTAARPTALGLWIHNIPPFSKHPEKHVNRSMRPFPFGHCASLACRVAHANKYRDTVTRFRHVGGSADFFNVKQADPCKSVSKNRRTTYIFYDIMARTKAMGSKSQSERS